jgi:hypothetical protein
VAGERETHAERYEKRAEAAIEPSLDFAIIFKHVCEAPAEKHERRLDERSDAYD